MTVSRYFHTVRHLKVGQVVNRLARRVRRAHIPDDPTGMASFPSRKFSEVISPVGCAIQDDRFTFLNETRTLHETGWDNPSIPKLWSYNLHYMDYLGLVEPEKRIEWITRWIEGNPPASGTGWEPYPLSLRVVNWCKWVLLDPRVSVSDSVRGESILRSIEVQSSILAQTVEWHLLGNHLFANAKALMFAALTLDSSRSAVWEEVAQQILSSELDEQFLEDGLHFELSPMYHAILVHDVLDLMNLMQAYNRTGTDLQAHLHHVAKKGISALRTVSHPDSGPAFMNDSAMGIAPGLEAITSYASRVGIQMSEEVFCADGTPCKSVDGYVRLESPSAIAVLDCASVGPDYLPGHAHADTLSFELSVGGDRVIVNSGTSTYEKGEERTRQRGTKAHSTVTINGEDSSEVWGGFRVARRARPKGFLTEEREDAILIGCGHDGYRWLTGKPFHRREWLWKGNGLKVTDTVEGDHQSAVARYHIAPSVELVEELPGEFAFRTKSGATVQVKIVDGHSSLIPSTFHPEFGVTIPNLCLEVALIEGKAQVQISWQA